MKRMLVARAALRVAFALVIAVLTAASIRTAGRDGIEPSRGGWRPLGPDS